MRRRNWIILLGLAAAGAAAAAAAFNGGRPIRVKVILPTMGRVEEIVTPNSVGTVEPEKTAVVASEIAGKILRISVRQGEAAAGGVVVELDRRDLEAELDVTDREIEASRARVEHASLQKKKISEDLERYRNVDVPKGDVERLERDLEIAAKSEEIARRSTATLEAQRRLIELRLRKTRIEAPFAGIVTRLHCEEGESVTPGRPLFTIHSAGPPLVRAPLDEVDMGRVAPGLPARVAFDAYKGEVFAGEIHEIMPAASADQHNNRTVDVKVRVRSMPPNVKAGMSANVEIVVGARDGVLRVPTHLVSDDREGRGRYVLVAENGRAVRRQVETGLSNWEVTEITGGLDPDDRVIVPLRGANDAPVAEGARIAVVADGS